MTKKKVHSISHVKSHLAEIVEEINTTNTAVIVTQNGEARAVIQDPETYEKTQQAIALFKILSLGEVDVRDGNLTQHEKVFHNLRKRLKTKS
ncbi:MAG: type II toxin-antitoxin system Phd/YefM family antitoxin [Proteobacteria bacterium]|jgi:prevent-host-death family protein|nr:type II toxin-antitoxin system Phd/YefM family antitoxin [Pseudomonadota bacterium]